MDPAYRLDPGALPGDRRGGLKVEGDILSMGRQLVRGEDVFCGDERAKIFPGSHGTGLMTRASIWDFGRFLWGKWAGMDGSESPAQGCSASPAGVEDGLFLFSSSNT